MQEVFGTELRNIAGDGGCYVATGTGTITGGYRAFVVNEDAVVNTLLGKGGVNWMTNLGLSGATLKQGTLITMPTGDYITSISLVSGSIVLYRL